LQKIQYLHMNMLNINYRALNLKLNRNILDKCYVTAISKLIFWSRKMPPASPIVEKTHTRRRRDLGRECWNNERERAAREMLRERRRRQSNFSAAQPGTMTVETDPGTALT
jgi:hypothetical protein